MYMKKTVPKPCYFLFTYFQNKTVLYIILFFLNLLWKQNYLRPWLTVYKQISFIEFFPNKDMCYVQWKSSPFIYIYIYCKTLYFCLSFICASFTFASLTRV